MNAPTLSFALILAGLAMVGPFAIDTFLPSFPAIGEQFAVAPDVVQQLLSGFLLAFAAMSLFYGTLSDAFGRRGVIQTSLFVFTAASIGAALSTSFGWLLAFRVLQGLSAGSGMVVGQAMIRDRFSGPVAQRLMAQVMMVFGLAPAIAPIAGGYLQAHFGWQAAFVFMALIAAVLLVACLWFLPESLPRASRSSFHPAHLARNYLATIRNTRFLFGGLAVGFAFGGLGLYIASSSSFVIHILGLDETQFAWLFVPMVGGLVLGSAVGSKLSHRAPPGVSIRLGFACMALGSVANVAYNLAFAATVPWAVLPVMVYTFGLGLGLPGMSLMTLELVPAMRGMAASLLNFMQMLIFAIMSGVVAPLLFDSALKLALCVTACFGLSAGCWAIRSWRQTAMAA
ncbi:multidrug effflux MFS transporter [Variovorax sp. RT4R15]|uniref:multidrug effflux MFS transporter n=1 Tax=Variovorax sp. RT4R15 TaxID=3443737 RepID=UPI003F46913B